MKFDEKLTITLHPIDRAALSARAYGEEYLAGMIHSAVALLDPHAKPLKIEVVLDEHVASTFDMVVFEYAATIEVSSRFGGTQTYELTVDTHQMPEQCAVRSLMTARAASIGQLLLEALQYPHTRCNHDTMLELVDALPSKI